MSGDVTQMLESLANGNQAAVDQLLPLIHEELHALADNLLQRERAGHTLQATALVHEVYLKMIDQKVAAQMDRNHFFAVAAQAMRRILVDHARARNREKRGSGQAKFSLDSSLLLPYESGVGGADLLDLDEALAKLETVSTQALRVVEMRYFGGLTIDETAAVMGLSTSTVEREWRFARAWLYRTLRDDKST